MPPNEITFEVEVVRPGGGRTPLTVFIGTPRVEPKRPGCWVCRYGWRGEKAREKMSYGATSLQALQLTVPILQIELDGAFPEGDILQDGLPFVFRDGL